MDQARRFPAQTGQSVQVRKPAQPQAIAMFGMRPFNGLIDMV